RVDALGRLEKNAVAESPAPLGRMRRPGRETLGGRELRAVRRLVRLPLEDLLRKRELVERPAEEPRDLGFERRAIERSRLVALHLEHRAALHELALHAEERREGMMTLHEVAPFVLDREEPRDEAVEVRRGRDQQLRLLPVVERRRIGPASAPA